LVLQIKHVLQEEFRHVKGNSLTGIEKKEQTTRKHEPVGIELPFLLRTLPFKTNRSEMLRNIVILASGSGTNAEAIVKHFSQSEHGRVSLIMSNRQDAYVLVRAAKLKIPAFVFSRTDLYETDIVLNRLIDEKPSLIVLAGFLWLIPEKILNRFPNQIINIHPALLPKYGGKGMYGQKVHEAVIAAKEKESGITIHYVNQHYDKGDIIFQAHCPVSPDDTAEILAKRIHELEYRHYPEVIDKLLKSA